MKKNFRQLKFIKIKDKMIAAACTKGQDAAVKGDKNGQ
jgi:hypothetical protein